MPSKKQMTDALHHTIVIAKKRPLTSDEVERILNVVKVNKSLPPACGNAYATRTRTRIRRELEDIRLYENVVEKFIDEVRSKYEKTLIQAGESVGILCAQSIGEMNTQMTLNSFHHSGISDAAMTEGVPRFQELLSATKNPKIVNTRVFFKERPRRLEDAQRLARGRVRSTSLEDIVADSSVVDVDEVSWPPWLTAPKEGESTLGLILHIDRQKLYERRISPRLVIAKIEESFDDLHCAEIEDCKFLIFSDLTHEDIPMSEDAARNFITCENKYVVYLEEIVLSNILKLQLAGIKGVDEVFYEKRGDGEWTIQTVGTDFLKILNLDVCDNFRTTSNNVWDIMSVFGIEAAHEFLLGEFNAIMKGINLAHTEVLVARMTFEGVISSISRYTLKSESSSLLGKASFEESLENFVQGSSRGVTERMLGNSASIICGKKTRAGTGFMNLVIDTNAILQHSLNAM